MAHHLKSVEGNEMVVIGESLDPGLISCNSA